MTKLLEGVTLSHILISAFIAALAIVILAAIKKLYHKYMAERKDDGRTKVNAVGRMLFDLIRSVVLVMAVIAILDINGVNVTSLVTGLGLASAVVGLALQDWLKDVIMGTHILADAFYLVGDVVQYNGFEGVVIYFNTRTTKIKSTADGRVLTVCNRNISEISKLPAAMQVDIDLPLPYEEDAKRVHVVLAALAEQISRIDGIEKCQYKGTQRFADSAILYRIRFFCAPEERYELERCALRTIQDGLAEAKITIPYNQMDVHFPEGRTD